MSKLPRCVHYRHRQLCSLPDSLFLQYQAADASDIVTANVWRIIATVICQVRWTPLYWRDSLILSASFFRKDATTIQDNLPHLACALNDIHLWVVARLRVSF